MTIEQRLRNFQKEVHAVAKGRSIRIVAVSKTHGPEVISELLSCGHRDFGENRQNEAREKFPLVQLSGISKEKLPVYHHIGPLQSGHARQIPGLFHWAHGVASMSALDTLHKALIKYYDQNPDQKEPFHYLIQIDATNESTKLGGMSMEAFKNLNDIPQSQVLHFAGFMTMGPENQDAVQTREVFHMLRELRDTINPSLELSMGMSGDWKIALEEGATILRPGSILFGSRNGGPWKPVS